MVDRKLLLLGLLRSEEMHGYQLNEFIDSHLGTAVQLKKPTVYRLLNKMADDGWVTYIEERDGNRPPRRVFAITPEGEAAFQQWLRESLVDYEAAVFPGNIGFLFLDAIPPEEAIELLQKRRTRVEGVLEITRAHHVHEQSSQWILLHQACHLNTELEWIDKVIAQLGSQASRSQDHSQERGSIHQVYSEADIPPRSLMDSHGHSGVSGDELGDHPETE
jgi:DNA-binding PadR family transcriptional regulator